ncbi:MAG TPA: hypothetical protein VFJ30_01560 [Phycisphaerae bacterium]|nr:hypothetical protein [Phycisphaerae bacterium]
MGTIRTGVSYMGHHNPRHLREDLAELAGLGCDDVLLAAQENDFVHMTGKLTFLPELCEPAGLRPIAIFWGVLNLFGGGRSSQFLLEHPEGRQMRPDGSSSPQGCYNNPLCLEHIQRMIDRVAGLGFAGYFVDEPTLLDCWCPSCQGRFQEAFGCRMAAGTAEQMRTFRRTCVIEYARRVCTYVKSRHPRLETLCCLMPSDRQVWRDAAGVEGLDNLGTDIYWANIDRDVEEMTPLVRELAALCRASGKRHHQWLQCWHVKAGREERILQQGRILLRERPDALYVWAYLGQIGTTEACDDPSAAWEMARQVLQEAKG